jgi:hypothetical protein
MKCEGELPEGDSTHHSNTSLLINIGLFIINYLDAFFYFKHAGFAAPF